MWTQPPLADCVNISWSCNFTERWVKYDWMSLLYNCMYCYGYHIFSWLYDNVNGESEFGDWFKAMVHPQVHILSSFTHHHVFPNHFFFYRFFLSKQESFIQQTKGYSFSLETFKIKGGLRYVSLRLTHNPRRLRWHLLIWCDSPSRYSRLAVSVHLLQRVRGTSGPQQ